jgi:hypothetical protein
MLLNVAAHNVSIQNVKKNCQNVNVTKGTASQNVQRHKMLSAHYVSITKRYVTVYVCDAVRYVTFTL